MEVTRGRSRVTSTAPFRTAMRYRGRMGAKPFNVRLDDQVRDDIRDRCSAGEATSMSEWAREALAGVAALGGLPALRGALDLKGGEVRDPHPPRALSRQRNARQLKAVRTDECDHPSGHRHRTPTGESCGLCGVTLGA